jgi:hypothetical protein
MNEPTRITSEEKARLTDSACHLFLARNPEFFPCRANSERLISFVHAQLGMTIDQYVYPITVDQWQAAYEHIKATSWFLERPVEEEVDPAVVEEQRKQQQVRDDYDARQAAAKLERDRNMPLKELAKVVSVQNADLRQQRETSGLPVRSTGMESRRVSEVKLGIRGQARVNVGLAHPCLDTHSAEFTKLYAAELARLRG